MTCKVKVPDEPGLLTLSLKRLTADVLALCKADNTLDLSPDDQDHEERSKPLDAEVEEAF